VRPLKRLPVLVLALALLWVTRDSVGGAGPRHHAEWLQADDVALRAVRAGEGDTTLLLLHGYGESIMGYRAVFDRLAERYRVVAVDLPGFGLSDKPDAVYDLASYERRMGDFLTRWTRGPVVVVGHSMGGEIAAALALDHPERVVAAVLIAPAGFGLSPLLGDSTGIASPGAAWVATALSYILPVHDSAWLSEPAARAVYEPVGDSAYRRATSRILRDFDFAALRERLAGLRQPTLILWGQEDPTIPFPVGEELAAQIPCHQLIALPNTLHRPHQTEPDTVVAEIEAFLTEPG
jgi:pimeloyl-ACP methyl ester carboxylesterase